MKNILTLEHSDKVHIVAYADTKANLLFLQYEDDEGIYIMDITKDDIDYMFSRKGHISMRVDRVPSEYEMNDNVSDIVFTSSKDMIKKFRKFVLDMLERMEISYEKFVGDLKKLKYTHCKNECICEDCELNVLSEELVNNKYKSKQSFCHILNKVINELEDMEV